MPTDLDPDLVHDASKGNIAALSTVLAELYPPICRLAIAVSGSTRRGLELVKLLITQSLAAAPKWQDGSVPWRWFVHHLILNLREHPQVGREIDPLLQFAAGKDLPYASFLKAMRKLPTQQVEAFVLSVGEQLDDRRLAIAMDCSVTAAVNHLAAANQMLKTVSAETFEERLAEFRTAYGNLTPDPVQVKQYVAGRVRAHVVPWKAARWIKRLIISVFIAAIAYGMWRAFKYMSA